MVLQGSMSKKDVEHESVEEHLTSSISAVSQNQLERLS